MTGALLAGASGWLGMSVATDGNVRFPSLLGTTVSDKDVQFKGLERG